MESKGEIVIYQNRDNNISLNVRLEDENVWLTQTNLVELYQSSQSNVNEHIKHIFEEEELDEKSVVRKFRTTAADGKKYETTFYNLDLIISLGYRNKNLKEPIAINPLWDLQHFREVSRHKKMFPL